MLSAYLNSWKIPELRKRIVFTFGIILLCRVTANIPCPGVNASALAAMFGKKGGGGVMDMFNLFSGGAMQKFAVGALGIMPYISASIIMQLMTPVVPSLEKMVREGETGRQKYNQITRYAAVVICLIQGTIFAKAMSDPSRFGISDITNVVPHPGIWFLVRTVITLTAGALFLMWLGEMITERGIGNGASLIITVNILARLPASLKNLYTFLVVDAPGLGAVAVYMLLLLTMFLVICGATVALIQGMRRIPIRYAKRMAGRGGVTAGTNSYLPLKVNYAGVMPIIFGGAIMMFPGMLTRLAVTRGWWHAPSWSWLGAALAYGEPGYILCYGALIMAFAFFWVANQFNPVQIADDLQKRSGYVPGIRPGSPTADFLDHTMTRITVAGATFLLCLAVLPMFLYMSFKIPMGVAQFFGGTSLLIVVGVTLDTMRQVEAHLLSRHYDGFLSKGRLRNRGR
ncbi:MAG: preprotein translocase subunit SecY [Victivallales bacterium]|jgi:preprotein translocase subunit SecY|nr:preprotein translocase subunit SecY [Victivallales bacterium]MBT7163252.1 preprotein translocase subunit SecY [Victivallales bacterium]MBT7301212.1 preprotein translocase subunit SecY [Victivallales bacterium]